MIEFEFPIEKLTFRIMPSTVFELLINQISRNAVFFRKNQKITIEIVANIEPDTKTTNSNPLSFFNGNISHYFNIFRPYFIRKIIESAAFFCSQFAMFTLYSQV